MKITVVREDKCMWVDGQYTIFDFTSLVPSNVRAIHYNTVTKVGSIEYYDAPSGPFSDESLINALLQARDARLAEIQQEIIDVYNSPEQVAVRALIAKKQEDIAIGLPSWQQVSDAIDAAFTNTAQRTVIKRMARVLYWLAKNEEA